MEKEAPAAEEPAPAIPEGSDRAMEKNKIQLRGVRFCSLEVENLRGGEESGESRRSAGQQRRSPRWPWERAGGHGSPSARPARTPRRLGPDTAADRLARKRQPRGLGSAGLCAIPAGVPGRTPAPAPHAAGAQRSAEQTLVVTSRVLPVPCAGTSTIASLPPEGYVLLQRAAPSEGEGIPPSLSPSSAGSRSGPRCLRPEGGRSDAEGCSSQALSG